MSLHDKREFSDPLIDRCAAWMKAQSGNQEHPSLLYHFTDADGLVGILNSRNLRASLITSLNDCSEVQYGIELAEEVLAERRKTQPSGFQDVALQYVRNPNLKSNTAFEFAPFIVSFCAEEDQSNHWLHYAQSGKGAALCFDSDFLAVENVCSLDRVEYSRSKQKELIVQLFALIESFRLNAPAKPEWLDAAAGSVFGRFLRFVCARFKSDHFQMEKEWRLITYEPLRDDIHMDSENKTKYRSRAGLVVPYQEIALNQNALRSVVLGYSSEMAEDDLGLRMLAHSACPSVTIRRSKVAVR
ncbi:MAG: DUF2971 domain-containing protein [Polyangia bacterium]|jgi:hypothetical protein